MKPTLLKYDVLETGVNLNETYPYEEYIINIQSSTETNCELVSWLFPNNELVQLIFYSPDSAEIFSMSPGIVLPEEGEEGMFYTTNEIKLFLGKIKAMISA